MNKDSEDNNSHSGLNGFKSPIKKLAESFKRSRDKLRKKYSELKRATVDYKIKIRDLSASRDKWKAVAKQLEKDLKTLREEKKRQD